MFIQTTFLLGIFLFHVVCSCDFNLSSIVVIETVERIKKAGYQGEEHHVQTQDGYVLTIFRISSNQSNGSVSNFDTFEHNSAEDKYPVLLMHGMLCSSEMFVLHKNGLGFTLANQGYDVWLGNVRGNGYGRNHTTLSPDVDEKFWDFSWHEMGVYDVPAIVDYILKKTDKKQLHYIGMSMGTTIFFVMGSQRPEYCQKIRTMVAIAPVTGLYNFTNYAKASNLLSFYKILINTQAIGRHFEFLPRTDLIGRSKAQITCDDVPMPTSTLCCNKIQFTSLILGGGVFPCGTSFKAIQHYGQLSLTGKFRTFDYGSQRSNEERLGSFMFPEFYNLSQITTPIAVFYTPTDEVVPEKESVRLISVLPNVIKLWKAPDDGFTHADFIISTKATNAEAKQNMTKELINFLNESNTFI